MIYKLDDEILNTAQIRVESENFQTFSIKIDCMLGYKLRAQETLNVTVFARFLGDVSWVNLVSSFLDLAAFSGIRKTIEIKIQSSLVLSETIRSCKFTINY